MIETSTSREEMHSVPTSWWYWFPVCFRNRRGSRIVNVYLPYTCDRDITLPRESHGSPNFENLNYTLRSHI